MSDEIIDNEDGTVTISSDFFNDICDDSLFLMKLHEQGVHDWEGYRLALELYERELEAEGTENNG